MRTLDRSRPVGQVFGLTGIRYCQDDVYFNPQGDEVSVTAAEPETEEKPKLTREELEGLHWTKLRSLVKSLDLEYTNREEAVELVLRHG